MTIIPPGPTKILTLSDEIRVRLPREERLAMTAAALTQVCELSGSSDETCKVLHAMHRRGEVSRGPDRPFRYWLAAPQRMPRGHQDPEAHEPRAQPAVAKNTGSASPVSVSTSLAGGRTVSSVAQSGAAAHAAAPAETPKGFRVAIYDDGELVIEADGIVMRLAREYTFRLCNYLERMAEVPGS